MASLPHRPKAFAALRLDLPLFLYAPPLVSEAPLQSGRDLLRLPETLVRLENFPPSASILLLISQTGPKCSLLRSVPCSPSNPLASQGAAQRGDRSAYAVISRFLHTRPTDHVRPSGRRPPSRCRQPSNTLQSNEQHECDDVPRCPHPSQEQNRNQLSDFSSTHRTATTAGPSFLDFRMSHPKISGLHPTCGPCFPPLAIRPSS
jgi:hypothetical protein